MNELGKAIRRDGRSLVELPEGMKLEAGPLRVRRIGRTITLEPLEGPQRIAPGHYTLETLPPLSEEARAILASIDAVAPLTDLPAAAKSAEGSPGIDLQDAGLEGIDLSDEGLAGLDPDR